MRSEELKNEVYITGHRNPDLDSLCSAYAYAVLKGSIDRIHEYKAVRCGHLSDSVQAQVDKLDLPILPYMRDVHPKVGDVMRVGEQVLDCNAPIFELVSIYNRTKPSAVAIFDGDKYRGLLSVDDITSWFLRDNSERYPLYSFRSDNFGKVIPGYYVQLGTPVEFFASIRADAQSFKDASSEMLVMHYDETSFKRALEAKVPAIVVIDLPSEKSWI